MPKKSDFGARLFDTFEDKLAKADLHKFSTIILEEGLYIGLMITLWKVSGRILIWEPDIVGQETFWAKQRYAMTSTLSKLEMLFRQEIPLIKIQPMLWAADMVVPWVEALNMQEDGATHYKAVNPWLRMIMVLMLPGLLRLFVNMTRQLVQLAKP